MSVVGVVSALTQCWRKKSWMIVNRARSAGRCDRPVWDDFMEHGTLCFGFFRPVAGPDGRKAKVEGGDFYISAHGRGTNSNSKLAIRYPQPSSKTRK